MTPPPQDPSDGLTEAHLAEIEQKYDEVSTSREVGPITGKVLRAVALVFAIYHYFTAGFGLPTDYWHLGFHLTGLFILTLRIFSTFQKQKPADAQGHIFQNRQYPDL